MVPVVTMDKGMFPDIPPFKTTRIPYPQTTIDGSPVIIGYTWKNMVDMTSGYVAGNASYYKEGGSPVILLKGEVTQHITGGGPVIAD